MQIKTDLIDLLEYRALHQPSQVAFRFLVDEQHTQQITYQQLSERAKAIALALHGHKGQRALLFYQPGLAFIEAFYGCLYAGVIAVPAYPPKLRSRRRDRIDQMMQDCQPKLVLTLAKMEQNIKKRLQENAVLASLDWIATDKLSSLCSTWHKPSLSSDLAFLQYTSGSTSDPKGVKLTHSNLLANLNQIRQSFDVSPASIGVSWLPPFHDMGLIGGILEPIYVGFPCTLLSPVSFIERPIRWLETISDLKATVSGGPNFAYDFCVQHTTAEQREKLDLRTWQVAFTGAEPIRAQTLERFTKAFAVSGFSQQAWMPCYGLAESTLLVSSDKTGQLPTTLIVNRQKLLQQKVQVETDHDLQTQVLVSSGHIHDQKTIIVDPNTQTMCEDRAIGEIWVRGESVGQGYWGKEQASQEIFQAVVEGEKGSYLRTGDLGFRHGNDLYVTGRLKDLIIIRGRNYYPQDIEAVMEQAHEALHPSSGAAFSIEIEGTERLVLVQELSRGGMRLDTKPIVEAIRRDISLNYELHPYVVVLVKPASIPKTSSGKIQRYRCKKAFLANTLQIVNTDLQSDQIEHELEDRREPDRLERPVIQIVAETLQIAEKSIQPSQSLIQYGLDSLTSIQLRKKVQENYQITLPIPFLFEASVSAICDQIANSKTESNPKPLIQADQQQTATQQKIVPATAAQNRMWVLQQLDSTNRAYNIPLLLEIDGSIDEDKLHDSIHQLCARHMALRTNFQWIDGELKQIIHPVSSDSFPITKINLVEKEPKEREQAVREIVDFEAAYAFDLTEEALIRVSFIHLEEEKSLLLLTVHHIISDWWSFRLLRDEWMSLYSNKVSKSSVSTHYVPIVESQAQIQNQLDYWQEKLQGMPALLDLPTDSTRPAVQSFLGKQHRFFWDSEQMAELMEISKQHHCSLFMTLLTSYAILLHRYSMQEDIVIGIPVSGRTSRKADQSVGLFVNSLPIRINLAGNPTFAELLAHVRQAVLEALENQDIPFDQLVEKLEQERSLSHAPIFQTFFSLEQGIGTFSLGDASVQIEEIFTDSAKFDLSYKFQVTPEGLEGTVEYAADLFQSETIHRMTNNYQQLLSSLMQDTTATISDATVVTAEEQKTILVDFNQTAQEVPEDVCLHQLFEQQVEKNPDRIAVMDGYQKRTYQELNREANQLAHYLQAQGVQVETAVGIYMERTVDLIVAMLAVLKAGGTYVPLDPHYPNQHITTILEDAQIKVVLTDSQLQAKLPKQKDRREICLDEVKTVLHQLPVNTPLSHVNAEHLAYLFFTSGSTGRPKAVMIEHRSPVARMYWAKEVYSDEELAGVFASTSICFDISILEIFVPLSWGGSVIVGENGLHLKSHPLASEVRLWFTVSTIAQELFQLNGIPSNLISMTIGAEPLSPSLVQALRTNTKVSRICHMYGPSEDTTLSTWGVVAGKIEKKVPIGRPISNTQIYIFDANQRPVPIGAIGEIFIGGKGLARGYYQKPIWTEERFITADDSTRLYQTGDLGRFLADGSIVFEGRKDRQIKLRGIRIELGEIEANLSAIPSVVDSVVEVVEVHNDKRLVAFLVWDQSVLYQSEQVREILAQRIPAFMVPSHFVLLESIPLKANGKINHDVLQRWSISHASAVKKETPITPLQKELSLIWEQVIGASLVGLDDNFFVLGGHSLLALKAIAMINEEFQIEISLRDIFEHPTIRQLEKVIEEKQSYQIEEQLLQEIENMSEEEVEQRLKEITENEGNNQ